jgi:hypothetical protein
VKHMLPITALVVLMQAHPGYAQQNVADPAIARIEAEGYVVSDIRRTWLGRIAITAKNGQSLREIVLNRTTGAVLSDQLFAMPSDQPATGMTPSGEAPSGPFDSGNSGEMGGPGDSGGGMGGGGMGGGSGGGSGGGGGMGGGG